MTVNARGITQVQSLPTLIASAAPYFGRDMLETEVIVKRARPGRGHHRHADRGRIARRRSDEKVRLAGLRLIHVFDQSRIQQLVDSRLGDVVQRDHRAAGIDFLLQWVSPGGG